MSHSEPLFSHWQDVKSSASLPGSWEFHERMQGEFPGWRRSTNVSPSSPPRSLSLLPFLSALPLHPFAQQLEFHAQQLEYSGNAYQVLSVTFQTPPLFLRTPPILILELMSIDCDICVRLWPKKGCTCWLSLVNSSAEDRKQISF